jgi:hypothetical protein
VRAARGREEHPGHLWCFTDKEVVKSPDHVC